MALKRKILTIVALLLTTVMLVVVLPDSYHVLHLYCMWVYAPLQTLRGYLFNYVPISFGDALYIVAGALLLGMLIKWGRCIWHWQRDKQKLLHSVLNTVMTLLLIYIGFVVGWGANYYQPALRESWHLSQNKDTVDLVAFDSTLVARLNGLALRYRTLSLAEVNAIAKDNYKDRTDVNVARAGLKIKYTYFSYFLDRIAIEGYYNPFTGEGQISNSQPAFMLPFVVSHEMAHQAGIAAEGDANLMAYALGVLSTDPSFNYSANLNLWLYVNARLSRRDSLKAQYWEAKLNGLTTAHVDTLEEMSKLYDNEASRYSNQAYDTYLKMQQQKGGVKTYGNVTADAWLLEKQGFRGAKGKLPMP